ncbi:MAG TPA: glycosyltransferase family 4 protein [Pyrinomonadaceae bacterium]
MKTSRSVTQDQQRRRIVFAWNYVQWGGAQVYFLAIMKVAQKDWDILVILPRTSSPEMIRYLSELNIEHHLVDYELDTQSARTLARKLRRQFNRIKIEWRTYLELLRFDVRNTVFQIEVAPWQSVTFLTAMALRGAKVFLTMHNFLPDAPLWRRLVWKGRFQFVSRLPGINFFCSNEDTKNRLRGWVNDEFWNRIRVTFTAVNPPQIAEAASAPFDRRNILKKHGVSPDDLIVLCVGQFIDRKGRWIFLEAAQRVLSAEAGISFVWLTPQLPSAEEEARIADFALGEKFRIVLSETLGKDRLDVLRFFRIADIFALPSYVEGLPIALLEAMALGIPSISTNVYAIPEAVKDMETGILIPAGDAVALATAIVTLKNDLDLRKRLASVGREYVVQKFDEREAAASAIEAYSEALT